MKIGMRHLQLFILLFAASSLLFQLPSEAFASTPSDITATDAVTDLRCFHLTCELNGAIRVDTFTIGGSTYAIVLGIIDDGVQIIDISDPTNIDTNIDRETDEANGFTALDGARDLDVFTIGSSTYAIVVSGINDEIQMIDISDPTDIVATDAETNGENGFTMMDGPHGVDTFTIGDSTYAIIVSYQPPDEGIQIVDISDPTDIVAKDTLADTDSLRLDDGRDVDTFTIGDSTYAIVVDYTGDGVQIIDISDPTDIVAKDTETDGANGFTALDGARNVSTFTIGSSTYAIVTSDVGSVGGVQMIDISDPTDIVATDAAFDVGTYLEATAGTFSMLDIPRGVDTFTIGSSTYAIVTSPIDDGVQIIDISDPTDIVAKDAETDGENGFTMLDGAHDVDTFTIGSSMYAIVASFDDDGVQIIELNTDTTSPTVTITSSTGDSDDTVGDTTLSYTVTFSESASNFVVGDITVTGTANDGSPAASNFAGSGTTYTFDVVQGSSDGTVSVSVAAGTATDAVGNDNTVSNTYTLTIDTVAPTVTITSSNGASGSSISSTTLSYTATFSTSVTDFTIGDITVSGSANAQASNFAGSGTTYTFDVVKNTSDGDVYVKIGSGVATDSAGNSNVISNTYSFTPVTFSSGGGTGTCTRHVILGNCGTIAINNDEYRIINTWTNVPTTEVLVGQPVTVTLSTPNNPTHTKIHFASVHTEVFSIPANFDQTAHIDYSIMSNKVTYVSQSQLFQVAGATHRIVQDPNVKNLEMFEVVFVMIFAKPMDTSHVVVETENKFGIPETLYLLDALKVNENLAQALTLEEKSKFSIVDPEPEMEPEPEMDPEPEPEPEMDPEPEQTKKEKSKRQRR